MAYSKAFAKNYALIDWSDLKPVPNRARFVKDRPAFHIIRDCDPFKSPITDEVIGGNRQRREHMKLHAVEEVGNERPKGNRLQKMPPAGPDIAIEMKKRGLIG